MTNPVPKLIFGGAVTLALLLSACGPSSTPTQPQITKPAYSESSTSQINGRSTVSINPVDSLEGLLHANHSNVNYSLPAYRINIDSYGFTPNDIENTVSQALKLLEKQPYSVNGSLVSPASIGREAKNLFDRVLGEGYLKNPLTGYGQMHNITDLEMEFLPDSKGGKAAYTFTFNEQYVTSKFTVHFDEKGLMQVENVEQNPTYKLVEYEVLPGDTATGIWVQFTAGAKDIPYDLFVNVAAYHSQLNGDQPKITDKNSFEEAVKMAGAKVIIPYFGSAPSTP
jgi:hypothetical protein